MHHEQNHRFNTEISPPQTAYRPNSSLIEDIVTSKLIIERTVTERNKSVHLIILDTNKPFDCISEITSKQTSYLLSQSY